MKPWMQTMGGGLIAAATFAVAARADLARDANTVRIMGEEGNWAMENAVQLEKDGDGRTWTFEAVLQYAPSERVQLLPVT